MQWKVVVHRDPETGDWASWCPTLPGCASAGPTRAEALAGICEAIALYLEPDLAEVPADSTVETVTV